MAQAGAVLGGRYVLDEQIGSGGYGEVWRAADTVLSRPVAIKLMHPHYACQGEAVARFRDEARHAAALSHENIAQVYDYCEAAGGQPPYLVMELVAGPSLETMLAAGPLDATRTMDIVAQTASGLQAAHAAGMIHRDVKPANLLLTPRGTVKITDFGIAHTVGSASVTATGELIGTPGYLAPERAMGEGAGPASDLYSLGIVAYECLTGVRPYSGTPLEVALAHRDRPLPPLPKSVGHDVTAFVTWLTAKDPASRLGDAAEVTARAALLRDGVGAPFPVQDRARRRAILTYACAGLVAVIIIVVASVIGFASPSRPAAASSSPGPASASPGPASASPGPASSSPDPVPSSGLEPVSRGNDVAARSSGHPAASPARPGAAPSVRSPAAHQQPAVVPVIKAVTAGRGPDKDEGNGPGKAKGKDKGKGNGNGKGKGKGRG
jgi:eukaryotic-like serine/threonine-protein kinase